MTLGLVISIGLQTWLLGRLKVAGPVLLQIERDKSLIADVRITVDEPFADRFGPLRHDFGSSIAAFQWALKEGLARTAHLSDNSHAMREASDNRSNQCLAGIGSRRFKT